MTTSDDKFYHAKVTQRADFGPICGCCASRFRGEFKFAPGQYATLGVQGPLKRSERPYSIVSSPYESEIEFFFELVPHGELSPLLHKLQPGRRNAHAQSPQGTLHPRHRWRPYQSPAGFDGDRRRALRQLRPHPLQRLERWQVCRRAKTLPAQRRQPFLGVWLPATNCGKFAAEVPWLKYVPTVSRPWDDREMDGRNRPRRRPDSANTPTCGASTARIQSATCAAIRR